MCLISGGMPLKSSGPFSICELVNTSRNLKVWDKAPQSFYNWNGSKFDAVPARIFITANTKELEFFMLTLF